MRILHHEPIRRRRGQADGQTTVREDETGATYSIRHHGRIYVTTDCGWTWTIADRSAWKRNER